MRHSARTWAHALRRDVLALWIAARDRRTPPIAKLLAGAIAAYALSPLDLIPDFVPILGLLDDLILVPVGIWLTLRLIPAPLMDEYRAEAALRTQRPVSRGAALIIAGVWLALLAVGASFLLW